MPGIFGIAAPEGSDALKPLAARMCVRLRYRSNWRSAFEAADGAVLGHVALNRGDELLQLVAHPNGSLLALDGVIYDWGPYEPPAQLRENSIAEHVFRLLQEHGTGAIPHFNGSFVAAFWDAAQSQLILFNDRYGLRPLFYSDDGAGRFAFASEAKCLFELGWLAKRPSEEGIVQLLIFGHLLNDQTLFEGIRLFPPGTVATWRDGRVKFNRYWDYRPSPKPMTLEEAADQFHSLVKYAVQRHLNTRRPTALLLSGGLDSRTVFASAVEFSPEIRTYTYGMPASADIRLARKVAEARGAPNTPIFYTPGFLGEIAEEAIEATEGMLNWECFQPSEPYPQIRAEGIEVLLTGASGDLFTGEWARREFLSDTGPARLDLFRRGLRWQPLDEGERREILSPTLYVRFATYPESLVQQVFESYPIDWPTARRSEHLRWYQFHRRMVMLGAKLTSLDFDHRSPFYDYELVDFIAKIPVELKVGQRFYRRAFAKYYPDLARITTPRYGLPVAKPSPLARLKRAVNPARNPYFWAGVQRGRFFLKRVGLERALPLRPRSSDGIDYPEWYRGPLRPFLTHVLLAPNARYVDFVRRQTVARMLQEHLEGRHDYHTTKLSRVITLELWLRRFFG